MNRYDSIKVIKSDSGKRMHSSVYFPFVDFDETDTYIITSIGDRLDTIAQKYYNNPRFWWVIAMVNDMSGNTLTIPPGTQLRLPASPSTLISQYNQVNK